MSWDDNQKDMLKDSGPEYPPGDEPWKKQSPTPWEGGPLRKIALPGARLKTALVALLVIGIAVLGFALFGLIFRSSAVYQGAMEAARSDERVVQALGEPINAGFFITGEISTSGLSGDASLRIPIYGPNGHGVLYAGARRENGVWRYYTLAVTIAGQDVLIDLR